MNSIQNTLLSYGFNEREIAVYLTLVKYTELSVFELAKRSGVSRTTVYREIENLRKKGIVNSIRKNNVLYYSAESPTKLLLSLKEKQAEIEEIMPSILGLMNQGVREPLTTLYVGIEGVKTVFEDILQTCKKQNIQKIYVASYPGFMYTLPKYFPAWVKRREDAGIKTDLIMPAVSKNNLPPLYRNRAMFETRCLTGPYPFDSVIEIYGNKTACISIKENEYYSIIIDSPRITNSFKQFFLFAWEQIGKNQ